MILKGHALDLLEANDEFEYGLIATDPPYAFGGSGPEHAVSATVATVLREQAKEMRAKRFARAREQAQKVPVKILMPLMGCFLPALFVIILGPAVYSIVQVFSSMGN